MNKVISNYTLRISYYDTVCYGFNTVGFVTITLIYVTLHYILRLNYEYFALCYAMDIFPLRYVTVRYVTFCTYTLYNITFCYINMRYDTVCYGLNT